jgi:hypothetical protein
VGDCVWQDFSVLRNSGADVLVSNETGKIAFRVGKGNINSGTTSNQHLLDVATRFNACGIQATAKVKVRKT